MFEAEESLGHFAENAVFERIAPLRGEEEGVRQAKDPECLHRMRVASRRLRSALPLLAGSIPSGDLASWRREIRRFTRALGLARDADVQAIFVESCLESQEKADVRPGLERLLLRMLQRRKALQGGLERALDRAFEKGGPLDTLEASLRHRRVVRAMAPLDGSLSHEKEVSSPASLPLRWRGAMLLLLRMEGFQGGGHVLSRPGDTMGHHALRILAKKLRYSMELFGPLLGEDAAGLLKRVKDLQGILGDLHDCDVWGETLPIFLEEERRRTLDYYGHLRSFPRLEKGLVWLMQDRRRERERLFRSAVATWRAWQEDNFWEVLRRSFRAMAEREEGGEVH